MTQSVDVAVVGGGILGLAHAWAAVRRGRSVVLFERDRRAQGASVRNFGMIWPIGQPAGEAHARAVRSQQRWAEIAPRAGIGLDPCGSLHLAYRPDEWAVLEEFAALSGHECALLTPAATHMSCPAVRRVGLLGALWSPTEACVDPRQAIANLAGWLGEQPGVTVRFGVAVLGIEAPRLKTSTGEEWRTGRVIVCGGADLQTLFPAVYAGSGIRLCKLQMMRTAPQPNGWRLGPMLAGGLTLTHYAAFSACPSLDALRRRVAAEMPEHVRYGIHVMAAQNALGEVVIGDSHEYGDAIEPFDKGAIDALILAYLRGMVELPDPEPAQRWHGIYAKHPDLPYFAAEPQPNVHVVTAPGGAGMTLGLGIADELWERWEP
jgi:FAD dependent oxidoreductase TIGR03364